KQVIVIRRDLKMRRGKEIAQGSHASMAFMSRMLRELIERKRSGSKPTYNPAISKPIEEWIMGSFAKVTLQAESEEQLLEVYNAAKEAGLVVHLITDSGKTEFHGEPTHTALAIGPDYADKIDRITGPEGRIPLKLY